MDPLSDILTLLRPTDYGFRGLDAAGAWLLTFEPAQGIRCFAIQTGRCWLRSGEAAAVSLAAGDVVLLTGGDRVLLYSEAEAPPIDAHSLMSSVAAGEIAVVNGGGACRGVGGFFDLSDAPVRALLMAVSPVVHVRAEASRAALVSGVHRLMRELSEPRPGSALLASHLAQALLVEALRAHLEEGHVTRGWLAALGHPALRRALMAMHADIARRWTLKDLAREAGMSRSSFAAHFERLTGETPIGYLTRWRMMVAADRLARSSQSLPAVAAMVGYQSESAFGAAFKRVIGCSPRRV